jgi:hypothetical protein
LEGSAALGQSVGILPAVIVKAIAGAAARFLVKKAAEWLVARALWYIVLRKVFGGVAAGRELTDEEIREADRLLAELDVPSVDDLRRVRRALEAKRK